MLTLNPTEHRQPHIHALRTVIVVGQPGQHVPDSAFDPIDYDVVMLEPMTRAYSQIKRVKPELVVVGLSFEDHDAFQLLSMLKLDGETAPIPVHLFVASDAEASPDTDDNEDEPDSFPAVALSMN